MANKLKQAYYLTKESLAAAKRECTRPPFDSVAHQDLIRHANKKIGEFVETAYIDCRSAELQESDFLGAEKIHSAFQAVLEESNPPSGDTINVALGHIFNHWAAMARQCSFYMQINIQRARHLLDVFIRCNRTNEVFGMALAGRAVLELSICAEENLQFFFDSFPKQNRLAQRAGQWTTEEFQAIFELVQRDIENSNELRIGRALFGSRLGTSTLGDSNKSGKRSSTPLWDNSPLGDRNVSATNIVTMFQKRAKRLKTFGKGDDGLLSYKLYELLCDIVHPSMLGNDLLMDEEIRDDGESVLSALRDIKGGPNRDWILAICIASASHSASILSETNEKFANLIIDANGTPHQTNS
jgi:hypothetical protein